MELTLYAIVDNSRGGKWYWSTSNTWITFHINAVHFFSKKSRVLEEFDSIRIKNLSMSVETVVLSVD